MTDISVIIPHGFRKTQMYEVSNIKYFVPKLINIRRGDTIHWINRDSATHHLISGNVDEGKPDGIFNSMAILPQNSFSKKIDDVEGIINYYCVIHPSERGCIIVNETQKNNTFLILDPELLNSYEKKDADRELQHDYKLARYLDPVVLETFGKPHSDILKNMILTVVFWDISGFSKLCEQLDNQPHLIIGFLGEFFNQANITIHNYSGILDKFVGDGILGIFGYQDEIFEENDNVDSLVSAISCAIELDKLFENIKKEWIEIWHTEFGLYVNDIQLKCAIHIGNVLVGKIITQQRDQFTVLGTTVNFASRLVDRAANKRIVVSKEVEHKLQNKYQFKKIIVDPQDKIKSFEHVQEYYQLLY